MTWTNPRTWVTGETVTAALMNTHVRDNLKAIGDAWTPYTPTISTWTLGNGTITGRYMQAGKYVQGYVKFTLGSTSAIVVGGEISLPVTALTGANQPIGIGMCFDTSASTRPYGIQVYATTTGKMSFVYGGGANTGLAAAQPFTWATGDTLEIQFTYEAA